MAVTKNNEKTLEDIAVIVRSSILSDTYKLKRIKEIVGASNLKISVKKQEEK